MLRNYFKTAWRGLVNNKGYSAINIGGLAVALGISVLLLWWVKDELSFDRFHVQSDRIYRVNGGFGSGASQQFSGQIVAPVAAYAKQHIPGVEEAVRVVGNYDMSPFKVNGKTLVEEKAVYVDPAFFTFFNFEWVKGNRNRPFPDLQTVVMTESAALKYFGAAEPVGKMLYSVRNNKNYVVSGIIRDFPDNSSIQCNMLFPLEIVAKGYQANDYWKSMDSDWGNWYAQTYFRLDPRANLDKLAKALTDVHHASNKYDQATVYRLQPLHDIHLYRPDGTPGAMQEVKMMGIVALILLAIGCINYVNLATAQATQRAKEVSVRKVVGAGRRHLVGQFLAESLLIFVVALALAIGLIRGLESTYHELTGKTQPFSLSDPQVWLVVIGVLVFTLAIAGIYPALVLSSFEPLKVLRGKIAIGGRRVTFRQTLVITQFAFSTALIVGTLIIGNQLRFMRERNLGYDRENVFSFWLTEEMSKHYEALKAELSREPSVSHVTASNGNLIGIGNSTGDTDWEGKPKNSMFIVTRMRVEKDFISSFGLKMAAGETFTGSKTDSMHVILNETAVKNAGIKNPIGKWFTLGQTKGIIIGVVKDFHFASLRQKVEPAVFFYRDNTNFGRIYIKTTGRDAPKAVAAAEKLWKKYSPDYPFEYQFMDAQYNDMYKSEQRTGALFNFFSGVAILVSCLGLFGLATFTAQQRMKEIGIRKVLGASVTGIVALLSKDFLKLVLIGILIASPVAWWAMNQWLQNFAYKIDLEWWVFALAGLLAVLIAFTTVSFQSIRAALMNPVKSLKSE
ncbi:ABC transporter permease [Larkinella terrae]|uniref:FtsX-like permease family protein n=1 Tax=Larkinella terrae TaxID=2025311 RepID=A0A7K0EQU8_9BACT|nr:ABC transporter permease [Larkinella terrae]MRS64193.1 FtsX-like permease family protein [Larkinella terrae]